MAGDSHLLDILDQLRRLPNEIGVVEFKKNWKRPDDVGQYISALANTALLDGHDRAWMIWGVDDGTGSVSGTEFRPHATKAEGNQSLLMWLQHMTEPRADFAFHEVFSEGKRVVMLEIYAPRFSPIAFKNVRYIRVGSHKTKLAEHPDKEARMWQRLRGKEDWSRVVVPTASLEDLEPAAIAKAKHEFCQKYASRQAEVQKWDDRTFLNKAKLTIQGGITRTALILLGREESAVLLSPAVAKMSWILKDADNREQDYEHFGPPFILNVARLLERVRNLKVRELPGGSFFPIEMLQYDSWVLREALHNCIAHQDYEMNARITVVEFPDRLLFGNHGSFLPGSVERVVQQDAPPEIYRNPFMADAMVNLNMIDTQGGGIKKMFQQQAKRYFPMPDYDLNERDRVSVTIQGRIVDERYTQLLMRQTDLDLSSVMLLDRVQKGHSISKEDATWLKRRQLIEGRYPRLYVSAKVAAVTGGQAQHIRKRGFDTRYYRDLLRDLIREHGPVSPQVISELIIDKLPDSMSDEQKRTKIRNLTFDLAHRRKEIVNIGAPRGGGARWVSVGSSQAKSERSTVKA